VSTTPKRRAQAYFQLGTKRSPVMTLELARTPEEQAQGLMGRYEMLPHYGMLFVYTEPGQYGFWMKGTHIPLDIAWLNRSGHVVDRAHMEPHDETLHRPITPVYFALELNAGALDKYGVKIGDRLVRLQG